MLVGRGGILSLPASGGGTQLILDTMSATAAAAYSTRKLRSAYAGNALQAKLSGGSTQNIGFVSGDLDTGALATFAAGASVGISTWYDQTANARNVVQSTFSATPQIVNSGTNYTQNGHVWASGTIAASTEIGLDSGVSIPGPFSVAVVFRFADNPSFNNMVGDYFGGSWTLYAQSTAHFTLNPGSGSAGGAGTPDTSLHSIIAVFDGASSQVYLDGASLTVGQGSDVLPTAAAIDMWSADMYCGEVIIFNGVIGSTDVATYHASAQSWWGTP
jgi:hypothetical protein